VQCECHTGKTVIARKKWINRKSCRLHVYQKILFLNRDVHYGTFGGSGIFRNLYFESRKLNLIQGYLQTCEALCIAIHPIGDRRSPFAIFAIIREPLKTLKTLYESFLAMPWACWVFLSLDRKECHCEIYCNCRTYWNNFLPTLQFSRLFHPNLFRI